MKDFYARLSTKENLPTTSFPSVEEYLQVFGELSRKAENILYIFLTSALSGAYATDLQAKEVAKKELPNLTIGVIDSHTAVGPLFFNVLSAAKVASQGEDLPKVIAAARSLYLR